MCNVERWLALRPLARRLKLGGHVTQVLRYAEHLTHSRTLLAHGVATPLFLAFLADTGRGLRFWREFRMGKLAMNKAEMDGLRLSLNAPAEPFWRTATRQKWCWFEVWGEVVSGGVLESFDWLFDLPVESYQRPAGETVKALIPGPYDDRRDCGANARLPIELVKEFQLWLSELLKGKAKREHGNIKAIRRKIEIARRISLLKAAAVH